MKKRWYLLLIAAGLLLCAVPLQFPQHLPKPVFALLAAGGSVLVGGSLGSLLCQVIRIRDPVLVQAYKKQHDERNTMICEKAAAPAGRPAPLFLEAVASIRLRNSLMQLIPWGLGAVPAAMRAA